MRRTLETPLASCIAPSPVGSFAAEVSSEGPGGADLQTRGHPDTGVEYGYLDIRKEKL